MEEKASSQNAMGEYAKEKTSIRDIELDRDQEGRRRGLHDKDERRTAVGRHGGHHSLAEASFGERVAGTRDGIILPTFASSS